MKNTFVALSILSILLWVSACEEVSENNKKSELLEGLTKQEVSSLVSMIELNNDNTAVKKIIDIEKNMGIFLVEYETDNGVRQNIGFTELIDEDNKLISGPYYTIRCLGTCANESCGLEGNGTYYQCKCDNCKLVYQSVSTKLEVELNKYANQSFQSTFKKASTSIVITNLVFEKFEKANLLTVHYKNELGEESSYMIVTNYTYNLDNETNTKSTTQASKDFVVDCVGSCDCRERFFPETGAIECTCEDCKMYVTQLQP